MASRERTLERALDIHRSVTGLKDQEIEAWLARMVDERLRTVLALRRQGKTVLEISERFSLTTTRIYQIEKRALRRIRYASERNAVSLRHFTQENKNA